MRLKSKMIKDEDLQWFGGKPLSISDNIRWVQAVKRLSKTNTNIIANRVPNMPIKATKRVIGNSILQNLNSSLDYNPFPVSQSKDAETESNLVEKQSGSRRRLKKPKVGGRKKKRLIRL